jgi:hypothetical protein
MPQGILLIAASFSQRVLAVWAKMTAIIRSPIADLKEQKNMTEYELKCHWLLPPLFEFCPPFLPISDIFSLS